MGLCLVFASAATAETVRPAQSKPKHLLLITVDTLRADHLGCYGHGVDTSPTIDQLARDGVRFADATVQWPKTWPSMASMMTSRYPTATGIRLRPRRPLPDASITWAEILHDNGFATGAVVANANLGRSFAFDQGFDHFVESWMEEFRRQHNDAEFENQAGCVKKYTDAQTVVDQGLTWIDELPAESRVFLWLHFMEPHGPYEPPSKYMLQFNDAYAAEPVSARLLPAYQRQRDPATRHVSNDLSFYKTQYDREIRYLDDQIARLLSELRRRNMFDDTLIVFTADHGESLGEQHYYLEHGKLPFQSTAHAPLILRGPGGLPGGTVVAEPVGLIDVLPTVLDLLDIAAPETVRGRSLNELMHGLSASAPPFVFMESGKRAMSQIVVRQGPWKLVHYRHELDWRYSNGEAFVLYNLEKDPGETVNFAAERPDVLDTLKTAAEFYVDSGESPSEDDERSLADLDEHTQRLLQSLGYSE